MHAQSLHTPKLSTNSTNISPIVPMLPLQLIQMFYVLVYHYLFYLAPCKGQCLSLGKSCFPV